MALAVAHAISDAPSGYFDLSKSQIVGALLAVPIWVTVLAAAGAYEPRMLGAGTDEYRRVLNAGLVLFATTSTAAFLFRLDVTRGFILWVVPLVTLLTTILRFAHRKHLHHRWGCGHDVRRTLIVGNHDELVMVAHHLNRESWAGFSIVGMCSTRSDDVLRLDSGAEISSYGPPSTVRQAVHDLSVDTLIVTNVQGLGEGGLRDLTWDLEDSHVHLIVAPAVTDIAGPRIASRPVAGLPLLHIEAPRLSSSGRFFKALFDRSLALLALVLLCPVLIMAAVLVKTTSKGPVFYRQTRVGLEGHHFRFLKFRTMVQDADRQVDDLAHANVASGPLFKIHNDPRITRVGRILRRFSIDELPQLFQVLAGTMSIVGPRPPLPSEVETYDSHVHRKFLVKPGMTGLWQVSGRSDLPWEEAVRLDLYYVDNWSPTMDVAICAKTLKAVFKPTGAY